MAYHLEYCTALLQLSKIPVCVFSFKERAAFSRPFPWSYMSNDAVSETEMSHLLASGGLMSLTSAPLAWWVSGVGGEGEFGSVLRHSHSLQFWRCSWDLLHVIWVLTLQEH